MFFDEQNKRVYHDTDVSEHIQQISFVIPVVHYESRSQYNMSLQPFAEILPNNIVRYGGYPSHDGAFYLQAVVTVYVFGTGIL